MSTESDTVMEPSEECWIQWSFNLLQNIKENIYMNNTSFSPVSSIIYNRDVMVVPPSDKFSGNFLPKSHTTFTINCGAPIMTAVLKVIYKN